MRCPPRNLRGCMTVFALSVGSMLFPLQAVAQVSVSDGGTPSYSQAIAVPPGVAGMAPKLSLFYSGGGVNGPLGHGWSVQGLSVITRCATTLAQDGRRAGVTYRASDKLCLDGQRLIQTDESGNPSPSGSSGGNNAVGIPVATQLNDAQGLGLNLYREFRTEKDIYARIRAYGYANCDSTGASGPAYFRVWTKAGQIFEYGQGPASTATTSALIAAPGKVPIAWAVARISDTLGNVIDFKYEQRDMPWGSGPNVGAPTPGHEWNIKEVQYSGNKVIFNYDLDGGGNDIRTDKSEAYHQGLKNVSLRRLKSITTYVNSPATALGANGGTPVRTTQLTYEYGTISKRSRISKIQECAGGPTSARCLPFTALSYASGGDDSYQANSAFTSGPLASLDLIGNGTAGVMVGDFNGDGKTDIIYWSDTPANNKLYTSNGDGSFTLVAAFNITSDNLFKSDGCYFSIAADFNGDGVTDILRVKRALSTNGLNTSCGAAGNMLYLGSANGSFTPYTLPSSIDLTQTTSSRTDQKSCVNPPSAEYVPECQEPGDYLGTVQSPGANFHLLDVDGDGYLDIVTTILPGFARTKTPPDEASLCASTVCTRVFRGQPAGVFQEASIGAFANRSVYAAPPAKYQFETKPYVVDFNGDGLQDLSVATGLWLSVGDGTFVRDSQAPTTVGCVYSIDFNGDGRSDCIYPDSQAATQFLAVGDGTTKLVAAANFNLVNAGQELGRPSIFSPQEPMGMLAVDINGDGRQDILRWKDDASKNAVYLGNGDGTFTQSSSFNLAGTQLQKSDGTASVILGDFTGRGNAEFLRLQTVGGTATNRLFMKTDSMPPDLLVSVTSPTGLTSKLYYVSLGNPSPGYSVPPNLASDTSLGDRYQSDRGQASYAVTDAVEVSVPMYVVVTQVDDTGVGGNVATTELNYRGLKADRKGRGLLGFREVLRQRPGAEGSPLTVDTQYVQTHPYTGVAAKTSTYLSKLNATSSATLLSSTSNFYCDKTYTGLPMTGNCPVTAKVARPYLYLSSESGKDLAGISLPTVSTTNSFNGTGDPTTISINTSGLVLGVSRAYGKSVSNTYFPDNTSCSDYQTCYWILGRLNQATVTNTVPNILSSIPSSAGTGTYATAIAGSGPAVVSPLNFVLSNCTSTSPTLSPATATYKCQLGNSGTSTASSMSYATSSGLLVVNGPSSCAANTPNCGLVSMQTSSVAGSYTGYFTVSSAGATVTSNSVTLTVSAPNGLGVSAASFSPASVAAGTSSIFSWSTTGASSASVTCTGAGVSVTGTKSGTAGNVTVGTTAATTTATCTVTATGTGGAIVSGSADLTVTSAGNVAVTSASFSPTSVPAGTSSSFGWNTANAASVAVSCSGAGSTATGSGTSGTISVSTLSVGTATCTVTAQDATGTAVTGSADLTVTAATAPVIDTKAFGAANVTTGGASTFSWSVSNATSSSADCSGKIAGSGTGTATGGSLTATADTTAGTGTCTVTATGAGGTTTGSSTINVVLPPSVTGASFSPTSVTAGGSSTFSWSTANASSASVSCLGVGATATASGTSGNIIVSTSSAGTATCTVSAKNAADTTVTGSADLTVTSTAPVIGSQGFVAANVTTGGTSTFSWSVSNATSSSADCSGKVTGNATGTATGGSLTATAATTVGTGTCTVTATGAGGTTTGSSTINVVLPPSVTGASFSPTSVTAGGSSLFSWSTANASSASVSCSGAGATATGSGTSGNINVGTTSAGTATCTVTAVNLAGTQATGFATLTVGSPQATLSLAYGGYPGVTTIDWGNMTVGTTAGSNTFILTNNSVTTATGLAVSAPSGWSIYSNDCGTTLPGGGTSCYFYARFQPQAVQSYMGPLSITLTNGTAPTFTFKGVGVQTATVNSTIFNPTSVPAGSSSSFSWTTTNATSASVSCSGAGANATGTGTSGAITVGTSTAGTAVCLVTALNAAGTQTVAGANLTVNAPADTLFTAAGPSGSTWTFTNQNSTARTITGLSLQFGSNGDPMGASINGGTCALNGSVAAGSSCTVIVNAPASDCTLHDYSVAPLLSTAAGSVLGNSLTRNAPPSSTCQ